MTPEILKADLIAGVTVSLVLIPQSMAYAQLAGLPAHYGLYAALVPVVVGALFGSSKHLATGPVAVVSLLTASTFMGHALPGDDVFPILAILLAMMVGVIQFALGIFRLGFVVNFLSHPVIVGFTNAAAIIIALSQLPKFLGLPIERSDRFLVDIGTMLLELPRTHWPTLAFGIAALVLMAGLKRWWPQFPSVLAAVALTTAISWLIDYQGLGGSVVGAIPAGLPSVALPVTDVNTLITLLPGALIIALVGFTEAISIAKAIAIKTKDRIDPNQELIGQGLANLLGSLAQAYPSSGSFSRTAVNYSAGAKTGLASLVSAMMVVVALLFLTPLLFHLPQAVLAAIIMMAVGGLIDFPAMRHAWSANRHDGVASAITFAATLGFAPQLDLGIFFGATLAVLLFLYRTMRPRVALLGRFDDGTLRDLAVHPDLPNDPRMILIRFDGQLYFANVAYFEDELLAAVAAKPEAQYVLVVGDGINQIDASGEEVLRHLTLRLKENGITLVFSGLKRQILQVMHQTGLYDIIGGRKNHFATVDMALADLYDRLGGEGAFCPLLPERMDDSSAPAAAI
ncbi:MAG: sulfate permease [Rhodospirillales bacterium]|nr:sulfate permease [Rhodospirillales bacterium]